MGYVRIYISHVQFTYKLVITQYLAVDVCSFFLQSNSTKKICSVLAAYSWFPELSFQVLFLLWLHCHVSF